MRLLKAGLLATALAASAASPSFADSNGLIGTLLGAGLGGFAGSNIGHGSGKLVATGAGVLIGGIIGNGLFSSHSGYAEPAYRAPRPVYYAPAPVYYAPPPVYYAPPPQVVYTPPAPAYYQPPPAPAPVTQGYDTSYCREGQWQAVIGGSYQQIYGTACRQPDGSWHISQ